ncbi:hypothetical protein [Streptomyces sp. NPDC007355]|uniref:hypothetical protein n=1 Tax=Streptomyces sp. NPDC007355 TaxID=3364778 RepID=UPI0036A19836
MTRRKIARAAAVAITLAASVTATLPAQAGSSLAYRLHYKVTDITINNPDYADIWNQHFTFKQDGLQGLTFIPNGTTQPDVTDARLLVPTGSYPFNKTLAPTSNGWKYNTGAATNGSEFNWLVTDNQKIQLYCKLYDSYNSGIFGWFPAKICDDAADRTPEVRVFQWANFSAGQTYNRTITRKSGNYTVTIHYKAWATPL